MQGNNETQKCLLGLLCPRVHAVQCCLSLCLRLGLCQHVGILLAQNCQQIYAVLKVWVQIVLQRPEHHIKRICTALPWQDLL